MKKYFSFIIPRKPIIFSLLSFSILYPDIVFANVTQDDTAYYYNERGKLLYCHVHAAQPASYVIKTKKSFSQIFHDVPLNDSSMQVSADYNPATVIAISGSMARKVARRL